MGSAAGLELYDKLRREESRAERSLERSEPVAGLCGAALVPMPYTESSTLLYFCFIIIFCARALLSHIYNLNNSET